MSETTCINRRQFLQLTGFGTLGALAFPDWLFTGANTRYGIHASPYFHPDVEIEVMAIVDGASNLPDGPPAIWQYQGKLLKGPQGTLAASPGKYLGAVFFLKVGQKVRLHFNNDCPEANVIHWHGLHSLQDRDTRNITPVPVSCNYVYEFQVEPPPGTYMYHAHTYDQDGQLVYKGLAGLIVVTEADATAHDRQGEQDNWPVSLGQGSGERKSMLCGLAIQKPRPGFTSERIDISSDDFVTHCAKDPHYQAAIGFRMMPPIIKPPNYMAS